MTLTRLDAAVARWELLSGLRRWAEGSVTDQAAVELLASWSTGRLIRPGVAWVRPCQAPGFFHLDGDALAARAATTTGDERRVLLLAAVLLNGRPLPRRRTRTGRAAA
jgi:hypothetical protein